MSIAHRPAAVALAAAAGVAAAKDWTTVRIGIEAAYPPFNGYNANNELVGFDYDIGHALCAKMKVECTLRGAGLGRHDPGAARRQVRRHRLLDVDHRRAQGGRRLHRQVLHQRARPSWRPRTPGITDVSPAGLAGQGARRPGLDRVRAVPRGELRRRRHQALPDPGRRLSRPRRRPPRCGARRRRAVEPLARGR